MRYTKTILTSALRRAFNLALLAEHKKTSAEEAIGLAASRRQFLQNTGKALLGTGFVPRLKPFSGAIKPRIAIVGGGLAGLHALHILQKNGLDATVYEASGRTGGRMMTAPGLMGEGTWAELGGEFIDTNHADMWALAKEFNLELIDYAQPSEAALKAETFFFNGRHYSFAETVAAFRTFAKRLKRDIDRLPDEISWQTKYPWVKKLDRTSLSAYLAQIGAQGWIKRLLENAFESEYGLSPQVQSSLNLLLLISPGTTQGHIELFGESDERYKVRGGNQQITDALAKRHNGRIETNRALESIRETERGTYQLAFSGQKDAVTADFVILALPFTKLRTCELRIPMPAAKLACIRELGYGTNAKLLLGMKTHFWREQGYGGLVYSDNGIPNGWDNAQLQTPAGGPAGLSILFGGPSGVKVGEDSPEAQRDLYLPKWNQIFPGASAQHTDKVARMHWPSHPFSLGSYVCPTLGQYTTFSGWEAVPVGRVLFAGEHCGGDFAGFMNGAAQSGREAAEAILKG